MGLSKTDVIRFEKLDAIAYEMFLDGYSFNYIAKELGVKRQSLSRRLKEKYDIVYNLYGKKNVDSNFFSQANPKSMYWLGFIFADGSLTQKGNYLEITIKDKEHLEKFKSDISSEHKISERKINGETYWRIMISDKQIYNDLINYGVLPRKSYIDIDYPSNIPKEHEWHFIRGFLDGDGNIDICKKSKVHYPMIRFFIGHHNKKFAKSLKDILNSYGLEFELYNDVSCQVLRNTKKDVSIPFLNMLYKDASVYLDRKYELIKTYCRPNSMLQEN